MRKVLALVLLLTGCGPAEDAKIVLDAGHTAASAPPETPTATGPVAAQPAVSVPVPSPVDQCQAAECDKPDLRERANELIQVEEGE